jgi:hypothetical protein
MDLVHFIRVSSCMDLVHFIRVSNCMDRCARRGERGARQQGLDLDQGGPGEQKLSDWQAQLSALGAPTAPPETTK